MNKRDIAQWSVAKSATEVHQLLEESDKHAASQSSTEPPKRNFSSSEYFVSSGFVHLLRMGGTAIAMITVSTKPIFEVNYVDFPKAQNPTYLTRLALKPSESEKNPLLGMTCLRKAIEVSRHLNSDFLRAEVNPKLTKVVQMLNLAGFEEVISSKYEKKIEKNYLFLRIFEI